jgi:hypothetical protein
MAKRKSYFELLTEAINHFIENGYTSQSDLKKWIKLLRESSELLLGSPSKTEQDVRKALTATFKNLVSKNGLARYHEGISVFTINNLQPKLQRELNKRILASANLIKLNREEAISTTLRRFEGWATSIPAGGSNAVDRVAEKQNIRKPLAQMDFKEKRVTIDQTLKLNAAINNVIATGGGAIAAKWHSNWRQMNYDYREDHKERDDQIYLFRESWAKEKGLVKPNENGYLDDITKPGEEVYCRCTAVYIYSPFNLPTEMLTEKGREYVAPKDK